MKKIKYFSLGLLLSLLLPLSGCNSKDSNLEPNIIKDIYRTYYEIFVGTFQIVIMMESVTLKDY